MNEAMETIIRERTARHANRGETFDPSALVEAEWFAPYLHEQIRVKVRTEYPSGHVHERTGIVGITTGWKPAFLLRARTSAHGSSDVLGAGDKIVAVKRGSKYVAV